MEEAIKIIYLNPKSESPEDTERVFRRMHNALRGQGSYTLTSGTQDAADNFATDGGWSYWQAAVIDRYDMFVVAFERVGHGVAGALRVALQQDKLVSYFDGNTFFDVTKVITVNPRDFQKGNEVKHSGGEL